MHATTKFLIAACAGLLLTAAAWGQQTLPPASTSQAVKPKATHKVAPTATHKVLPDATHKVSPAAATTKPTPPPPASTGAR
ncbi:MAG: hypothetical protein ACRETQ_05670 [Gammaproteobacteria bacterium]